MNTIIDIKIKILENLNALIDDICPECGKICVSNNDCGSLDIYGVCDNCITPEIIKYNERRKNKNVKEI